MGASSACCGWPPTSVPRGRRGCFDKNRSFSLCCVVCIWERESCRPAGAPPVCARQRRLHSNPLSWPTCTHRQGVCAPRCSQEWRSKVFSCAISARPLADAAAWRHARRWALLLLPTRRAAILTRPCFVDQLFTMRVRPSPLHDDEKDGPWQGTRAPLTVRNGAPRCSWQASR